ncbi:hypothetical protein [Hyphomonas sp.]|uniref:hypothetical protein n=1 Tax=Hyphomonas sp. TaxID=87 RepID=UPI0037C09779
MIYRNANPARRAVLTLVLCASLAVCGKDESPPAADEPAAPQAPGLLDTTVAHTAYGTATVDAAGDLLKIDLKGEGEGGVALALGAGVTTDTVVSFTLDAPAPLNLRLAKPDGTFEYGSTEMRSHVVLGPGGASEALLYTGASGPLNVTIASVQPCGGAVVCHPDGTVEIRIDGAAPLIASAFGPSALSSPEAGSVTTVRGTPTGEFGFSLAPETEREAAYLLEFSVRATEPINVLVRNGENSDYISSEQGWVHLEPGSSVTAYTPGPGTFTFSNIRATDCTPEDTRCSAPAP